MQNTTEPVNTEKEMPEEEFLVLKTDLKGTMIYGNRSFIEFSGYEEKELIGQPHKMLRHPDMPRAIFRLMWETLEDNREFFGYLKYLRKDGSYFWSFANLTPSFDDNQKVNGSFSVQRKPHPKRVAFFSDLYQKMVAVEKQYSTDKEMMDASTEVLNDALNGRDYDEFIFNG
jgi:PAS domain S-box-containing protein